MVNYRNLDIWINSVILVEEVYKVSKNFPKDERFGLTSQMRRSSISIPSNIAEGCSGSKTRLKNYLRISLGSANELETQIIISANLNYLKDIDKLMSSLQALKKQIYKFYVKL